MQQSKQEVTKVVSLAKYGGKSSKCAQRPQVSFSWRDIFIHIRRVSMYMFIANIRRKTEIKGANAQFVVTF